ncbi:Hypothetical predicted protein [Xyrichtys novacula]|uniref:Uncharacterized protein n=1 Tax=Xyrichtys novacula TaxID=13765 RepID=A0AAV1G7P2_XYRNO|nr:Hypothetical predicted protein [Xyrichtys novacula]
MSAKSCPVQLSRETDSGQDDDRRYVCVHVCVCVPTSQNESLLWTEENLENREKGEHLPLSPSADIEGNTSGAETLQSTFSWRGVCCGSRAFLRCKGNWDQLSPDSSIRPGAAGSNKSMAPVLCLPIPYVTAGNFKKASILS